MNSLKPKFVNQSFSVPTAAFAADHADQVRVIVENTTYTAADAPWTGTLVDKWVDLKSDSTMMSCLVDALGSYSQTGAESGYISEINDLRAGAGGAMSGWMGSRLNASTNAISREIIRFFILMNHPFLCD